MLHRDFGHALPDAEERVHATELQFARKRIPRGTPRCGRRDRAHVALAGSPFGIGWPHEGDTGQLDDTRDAYLDQVLIGGREHVAITVVNYDLQWPRRFEDTAERVRVVLRGKVLSVEHRVDLGPGPCGQADRRHTSHGRRRCRRSRLYAGAMSIGFVLKWDVTDRRAALIRQRGRQHVVTR